MPPWGAPLPLVGPVSGPPQLIEPIADEQISGPQLTYEMSWAKDYAAVVVDVWGLIPVSSGTTVRMRTSGDGGSTFDAGAGDYRYNNMTISWAGVQRFIPSVDIDYVQMFGGTDNMSNAAGFGAFGRITFRQPLAATYTEIQFNGGFYSTAGPGEALIWGSGKRLSAARVDAYQLYLTPVGNLSSGRISTRGVLPYGEAA